MLGADAAPLPGAAVHVGSWKVTARPVVLVLCALVVMAGVLRLTRRLAARWCATAAVLGLDVRPQSRAHVVVNPDPAAATGYAPQDVARRYGFPTGVTGAGVSVRIKSLST